MAISPTDPFVVLINSSRDVISDHPLSFSVKKKRQTVKTWSRVDMCIIYIVLKSEWNEGLLISNIKSSCSASKKYTEKVSRFIPYTLLFNCYGFIVACSRKSYSENTKLRSNTPAMTCFRLFLYWYRYVVANGPHAYRKSRFFNGMFYLIFLTFTMETELENAGRLTEMR